MNELQRFWAEANDMKLAPTKSAPREVFFARHMSPRKTIPFSSRLRARTLRGFVFGLRQLCASGAELPYPCGDQI